MKNAKLLQTLENIGLSKGEAEVYLASLSLGPSTVKKIANASEVKRTTVYSIVESLKQKGLMHIEEKGFKKFFVPESPEKLEIVLEKRKKEFHQLLPEFSSIYSLKESDSTIRYYEGLESIKGMFNMIINDMKAGDEYVVVADQETWYKQDPKFFQDFMERRAKLPIKPVRMLLQDSAKAREHQKFQKNFNLNIKLLPTGTESDIDIVITPQHVMFQQYKNPPIAFVIDNQSIIKTQKMLFETIWKSLPNKAVTE